MKKMRMSRMNRMMRIMRITRKMSIFKQRYQGRFLSGRHWFTLYEKMEAVQQIQWNLEFGDLNIWAA